MKLVKMMTVAGLAAASVAFAQQSVQPGFVAPKPQPAVVAPAIPATPAAIKGLVYARPFTLDQGFPTTWRAEQPMVTSGWLVVLDVNPALVYPRQGYEPVLYAGDQTVERINVGYLSGKVVAIIPSRIDLKTSPIWFGTPELPERVTAGRITQERALATRAGVLPAAMQTIDQVTAAGGELRAADKLALLREASALIIKHAPDERELAQTWLRPRGN